MVQKRDLKNRDSKGKGKRKREGYYNGEPYGYSSSLPKPVVLSPLPPAQSERYWVEIEL
jgi:hypothetical protein